MRIFILLSRIPWPLEKGDKLRAYNQIKCLSRNNKIFLCALNDEKSIDIVKAKKELEPFCEKIEFINISKFSILWNLGKAFFKGLPLQCGYFYNKNAHHKIQSYIQTYKPDILFGQLVRVAPYLINEQIHKVIDYQDVLSMGMKRRMDLAPWYKKPIFRMEYLRLQKYEHTVFDKFDIKTIISDSDRQCIAHEKKNEILIIPNGVDFELFNPIPRKKNFDIIFSGNMAYPPNVNAVDFLANEIMPIVWKQKTTARVCIAGATPTAFVRATANEKITITGWVDDMKEMYAQSCIFIAPMRIGTGLQNKLLEAMAMNMPCITTPLANGSLQATNNKEILVGTTAEELANHILTLLNDVDFAYEIAHNGNTFVHKNYDWWSTTKVMEDAMNQIVK